MKLKHWGHGLRALAALVVCLPVGALGLMTWFGFYVISDFVDVAKKAIVELPAEKGIEIANLLARVHDRSEFIMFNIALICSVAIVSVFSFVLIRFFGGLTSRGFQVVKAQTQMSGMSEKLTDASDRIELSSQQSTAALEQTAANLEMVSSSLHRMAVEVTEADRSARMAVEASEKSGTELGQVIDSLGMLIKQSKKLEEITGVIESIAFQTNILAVNAAVEAARAGEQGRGFAIVAEAVRNLAQTSAASAKNISSLIRDSGETSKRAIQSIRSGTAGLSATHEQIRKSHKVIGNVIAVNSEIADSLSRMSQSFNQLESTSKFMLSAAHETNQMKSDFTARLSDLQQSADALSAALLMQDNLHEEVAAISPSGPLVAEPVAVTQESRPVDKPQQPTKNQNTSNVASTMGSTQREIAKRNTTSQAHVVNKNSAAKSTPNRTSAKPRARDIIPFEGESESETAGDSKIGSISGF